MSNGSTFLDVEDDEQRQKRIGSLLERLNTTSSASSVAPDPLLNIAHQHSSPGPVEPPAELLARVQAFLPVISASNGALSEKKPEDIDIENVAEDEEQYVEMNLGLGVFEAKHRNDSRSRSPSDPASSSDVTPSESGSDSDSSSTGSEEDEDEDSGSESDSDSSSSDYSDAGSRSGSSVEMKPISSRPIKPLPRRVSQQAKLEV